MKKLLTSLIIFALCYIVPNIIYANNIPETKISVDYRYKSETNTVIVTMTSNNELINNKTTWKLSEDKKQFVYEFEKNTTYISSVLDVYGRTIYIPLSITQIDQTPAKIVPTYEYKETTNTVIVTLTSNKRLLNNKTTWKLSTDEKVFIYEFDKNTIYNSTITDIYGNIIYLPLKVTQIDQSPAQIVPTYEYKEDTNTVIVTLTSDKKLLNNKTTWKISEDQKKFTYEFKENTTYNSKITDIYGNIIYVPLKVTQIKSYTSDIGIDVSHHNGKIDWEKVKNSGIGFAIIRVGYGQDIQSQDDKMFEYNITECERLGIPYGVYIYSYALNVEQAKSEAEHVLRLIKGHNPEYGIWYDLEDDDYKLQNGMPSNKTFIEIAETFCEKIKSNGYKNVGIYANLYWLDYKINSSRLDKYDKWVAQWGDKCTYEKEYVMWQYTDKGKVDGIEGNVDLNRYYGKKINN